MDTTSLIDGVLNHLPLFPKVDETLGFELFKHKELNELVLEPSEKISNLQGQPLSHQELESRIFSPVSPYDKCIFYHKMGTGKTCLVSFIFEHAKKYISNEMLGVPVKKALVIVPNKAILNNFIVDIESKCTSGVYSALGITKRSAPAFIGGKNVKSSKQRRAEEVARRVRESYEFTTVASFARNEIDIKLDNPSYRNDFIENHSNRYIVIDEAHHLKSTNPKYAGLYKSYHRFLHSLKGSSVFLLTGTPMVDDVSEIASLLNLVNDLDKQLPEGTAFIKRYFTKKDGVFVIKQDMIDDLKSYMRAKISVLRSIESNVRRIEVGRDLSTSDNVLPPRTSLYFDVLSDDHYSYMKRFSSIKKKKKSGENADDTARKGEMDAIGFMFIDKTKAKKWCKGCEVDSGGVCLKFFENHITLKGKRYEYMQKGLGEYIRDHLDTFSTKFASIITCILQNPNENVYIYNELIRGIVGYGGGGGIINFGLILEAFGYVWITPGMIATLGPDKNKRRFAIVSSDEGTFSQPAQRTALIDKKDGKFNIKENAYGDYCQVIIGSQAISEGVNLYNVRHMHVTYAHWNKPGTEQAESRADRYGAHEFLLPEERYLKFYHHASVPSGKSVKVNSTLYVDRPNIVYGYPEGRSFTTKVETVDLAVYMAGYRKYYPMAQIRRVAKEASIDCIFTYRRNVLETDVKGSGECDYQDCNYICDGTPNENVLTNEKVWQYVLLPKDNINIRSAVGLYSGKDVGEMIPRIERLFMAYDSITLLGIQKLLLDEPTPYDTSILIKSLSVIISTYHPMRNKYGARCYLKEKGNVFYLSYKRFQNLIGNLEDTRLIRGKYPITLAEMMSLDRIDESKDTLDRLCKSPSLDIFKELDPMIATDVAETVLCCIGNDTLSGIVKTFYRGKIFTYAEGLFHTILASDEYTKTLLRSSKMKNPPNKTTLILKNMKKYMKNEGIRVPILTKNEIDEQLRKITGNVPLTEEEMILNKYSTILNEYASANGIPNLVNDLSSVSFSSQLRIYLKRDMYWKYVDDPILENTLGKVMSEAEDLGDNMLAEAGIDENEIYGMLGPNSKKFIIILKQAEDGRPRSGRNCPSIPIDMLHNVLKEANILPIAPPEVIARHSSKTITELENLILAQKGTTLTSLYLHYKAMNLPEDEYRSKLYGIISLLKYRIKGLCAFIQSELLRKGKVLHIEKPTQRSKRPARKSK